MINTKKGQEEMMGFGLIIILVSVILLVFLGLTLSVSQKDTVESYEVESFIQASLQYTTTCKDYLEYLSVQKLIFDCKNGQVCVEGGPACEVLEKTLSGIIEESWKIEGDRPIKGYNLRIYSDGAEMFVLSKGNLTGNSKGAMQDFSRGGSLIEIYFSAYY
ncbi:MAG TPA: hypothetical protein VJB35_02715 [Candidatus Nanoarchaeia archaeon]|nr:hypothetical protein [Candidatus Nanoarchaeia archaeon]